MVKRGDIYSTGLSPVVGSEQGGVRPALVAQNNLGNHFSPMTIIVVITVKTAKPELPIYIGTNSDETGIGKDSVILLEQIRIIDKGHLKEKVCHLRLDTMEEIDRALGVSIGFSSDSTLAKANSAT